MRMFLDELVAAARGLARDPAFTALAIGVLGFGLGAVIFMYGVIDTLLLRPPPYPSAERIHVVATRSQADGRLMESLAPHDYATFQAQQQPFEALGTIYSGTVYLSGEEGTERVDGGFASAGLFDVAGVGPAIGRVLEHADELPGAAPVVLLGDDIWRQRYGADPDVIGRSIRLNRIDTQVIGVMPPGFSFPKQEALWMPSRQDPAAVSRREAVELGVYGRLRPGLSVDEAQQLLVPVAASLARQEPELFADRSFELVPYAGLWVGDVGRKLLLTLLAAVGLVLLIACANVSNLLLARAAWRVRETTVRAALGASRGRLVLHAMAESAVVCALAVGLALLLAALGLDAMQVAMRRMLDLTPPWVNFEMGGKVVLVTVLLALATTLLAGLPAALRASRPDLDALLRDGGRMGTGLAISRIAWTLVVAEVALAAALLGGAALMTRSVLVMTFADVGVDTAEYMTARVGLPRGADDDDEQAQLAFFERYVERLAAQPEVAAAGLMGALPMLGDFGGRFAVEGRAAAEPESLPQAAFTNVSPSLFETLHLPLLQGRSFDARDQYDGAPVVIINEALAEATWPGESALGRRLRFMEGKVGPDEPWRTVVGVVPDIIHDAESGGPEPAVYVPLTQEPARFMSIVARSDAGPQALPDAMHRALLETDPDLALYWVRPLDESIALRTAPYRIIGGMFVVFGVIALALAAAGLFGVLSFHVGQRTREIGLRRALGADDRGVLALILRAAGTQVAIGLAIGLATLPLLGRSLAPALLNLSPNDPVIYGGVLLVMATVALVAALRPTLQALRVDPAVALRYE